MISRPVFIRAVVAPVLFALAITVGAQPSTTIPKIGIIQAGSAPSLFVDAFQDGMRDLGYVEGRNVTFEVRYAEGWPARLQSLAADLVRLKVDLIVAGGGASGAQAAQLATRTIPVVVPVVTDPVGAGLVTSLARPGGNITGLSMQNTEITAKRLELLKYTFPKVARVAVLYDSGTLEQLRRTEVAGRALGIQLQALEAGRAEDFERLFEAAKDERADALVIVASSFFYAHRRQLVELAAKHRVIAVYEHREFSDAGGLMSYGPNLVDMYRRAAVYVDKILKGAKPGDLPIEQPTKFELVINLKTAKALGLTIPQSVLLRADEVIQ